MPLSTYINFIEKIMKAKQKLTGLKENELNLEQVLEENKKIAEEMNTHLI